MAVALGCSCLAASQVAAGAQPAMTPAADASPVTIDSCGPIVDRSLQPTILGDLASQSHGIQIEFVNDSSKTADLVNFAVDSKGERFIIRDVGTFSPGVSIDHQYRNGSGQAFVLPAFIAPTITCHVASVKFTDGSAWRRGLGAVPSGQAISGGVPSGSVKLSANPPGLDIDRATESELFMVSSSERVTAFRETDNCATVAGVFVVATGQSSATYSVKPLGAGSCTAHVADEAGNKLAVPIVVR